MEAIIPPNGSNHPIVIDEGRHHHHGHGAHHMHHVSHAHGHHKSCGHDVDVGLANMHQVRDMGLEELAHINRVGDTTKHSIERGLDSLDANVDRTGDKIQHAVERFGLHISEGLSDIRREAVGHACDIKESVHHGFRDSLLQAANNTAAIQLGMASNFKDVLLQNAANAAASAQHHCEIKELIRCTAQKTDDLIRCTEQERLREKLAETREELIALRVRATLPPALVGSAAL